MSRTAVATRRRGLTAVLGAAALIAVLAPAVQPAPATAGTIIESMKWLNKHGEQRIRATVEVNQAANVGLGASLEYTLNGKRKRLFVAGADASAEAAGTVRLKTFVGHEQKAQAREEVFDANAKNIKMVLTITAIATQGGAQDQRTMKRRFRGW